jgi:predicted amidohydrolase
MRVAAIQMVSTPDPKMNIVKARALLLQAKEQGAQLAVLPEYWSIMGMRDIDKLNFAEDIGSGELQDFLSSTAKELAMIIIAGTIPIRSGDAEKIFNATIVFDTLGRQIARYDKIHLFGFNNGDESYQESNTIEPGHEVVTFETSAGRIGLAICYDLRFPELFRAMGKCSLIVLPAAFTFTTGQAHWEILLRARAIENQCYVLASAQGGLHENGRRTWGHSMLIDPWGKVVNSLGEGEGLLLADIEAEVMTKIRQNLPALSHRKLGNEQML